LPNAQKSFVKGLHDSDIIVWSVVVSIHEKSEVSTCGKGLPGAGQYAATQRGILFQFHHVISQFVAHLFGKGVEFRGGV